MKLRRIAENRNMAEEQWKWKCKKPTVLESAVVFLLLVIAAILLYPSLETTEEMPYTTSTLLEPKANGTKIEACTCDSINPWKPSKIMKVVVDEFEMKVHFKLFKRGGTAILVLHDEDELLKIHIGLSKKDTEVRLVQKDSVLAEGNSAIGTCYQSEVHWREFILNINISDGSLRLLARQLGEDILILKFKIGKGITSRITHYHFVAADEGKYNAFNVAFECTPYKGVVEGLVDLVSLKQIQNCVPYKISKEFFCRPPPDP